MSEAFNTISDIEFPEYSGIFVNMMPIIFGVNESIPDFAKQYAEIINKCSLQPGAVAYLTIHESYVESDKSQRRGGVHVEAPNFQSFGNGDRFGGSLSMSWGGGAWGGLSQDKGIYMASTDGNTSLYDEIVYQRDIHGGCNPTTEPYFCLPSMMYWITDLTPHEALLPRNSGYRQFFRLVSEEVSIWFKRHNTPNPLGVKPSCPTTDMDKFEIA